MEELHFFFCLFAFIFFYSLAPSASNLKRVNDGDLGSLQCAQHGRLVSLFRVLPGSSQTGEGKGI